MVASWAIPIASLSAICGVAILFVLWWFPRTWNKGTREELEIRVAEREERERYIQQMNAESIETSEGAETAPGPKEPPKAVPYTPPAYTSF